MKRINNDCKRKQSMTKWSIPVYQTSWLGKSWVEVPQDPQVSWLMAVHQEAFQQVAWLPLDVQPLVWNQAVVPGMGPDLSAAGIVQVWMI